MQQLSIVGLATPPAYCQYVDGNCDQDFSNLTASDGFFVYPSDPPTIAAAVEAAADRLGRIAAERTWRTWRQITPEGRVIFCEICKAMRSSKSVVADVTTLSFNVLFEIGFAIGLGIPVIPIRDTSYVKDKASFDALGVLDTIGYVDFANGNELAAALAELEPREAVPLPPTKEYKGAPIYVLKGPHSTEGTIQMLSTLKKSRVGFRTYDPTETPRLSIHEVRKQVSGSVGVVGHLLSPNRRDAMVHNALTALVCGIAMAEQKVVVMLQEEHVPQPIDYRDVVQSYTTPREIAELLEKPILEVVEHMQRTRSDTPQLPESGLERLDLGDSAAENEIIGLRDYFVRTGQFRQAAQGHGRLVVGRKGSGKTAIFYEIRDSLGKSRSELVLDLKPEGHQFTRLSEAVLQHLPQGAREHTVTAFWNYILLCEMAHKILQRERHHAHLDPERLQRFDRLEDVYSDHAVALGDDLSQRLLRQVERLVERFGDLEVKGMTDQLTEAVYRTDIRALDDAVSDYLQDKEAVWLLIDNLDKSWATRGTSEEDMLIVRGLLEATRKLQHQLEERDVEFRCLVFIRTDVHEHLVRRTPDRDKDTAIRLDWDDAGVFQEIIRLRIRASTGVEGDFAAVWQTFFASHVAAEDSFGYMLDRTLMRPRDLLKFVQRAVEVSLNRGHTKVTADDILQAEQRYSEDMFLMVGFEIEDIAPELAGALFAFVGTARTLTRADVDKLLDVYGVPQSNLARAVELLVWFGFLGVAGAAPEDDRYAYQVQYNIPQLVAPVDAGRARFVIHPAFRKALGIDA